MGVRATELDAVAYSTLPNIMNVPIESPIKDEARKHSNLVGYLERVSNRYFV